MVKDVYIHQGKYNANCLIQRVQMKLDYLRNTKVHTHTELLIHTYGSLIKKRIKPPKIKFETTLGSVSPDNIFTVKDAESSHRRRGKHKEL